MSFDIDMKQMKIDGNIVRFPTIHVGNVYNNIKNLNLDNITLQNISTVILAIMSVVDKYKDLTGVQKKAIVLDTLYYIVEHQISSVNHKNEIIMFIKLSAPLLIDNFISLDKRELRVKLRKTCSFKLCGCMNL